MYFFISYIKNLKILKTNIVPRSNAHYCPPDSESGVKLITCDTVLYFFILGLKRWYVWFGMKEGSEGLGCILYLSSFSSEATWLVLKGANAHWVTPGQRSNILIKSHNTQTQDFWTSGVKAVGSGGGKTILDTASIYNKLKTAWFTSSRGYKTAWFTSLRGFVFWPSLLFIELALHPNETFWVM